MTDRMSIKRQEERTRLRRIKGQTVCPNGMRADGPQGRELKARMLALRTEKDSLDAQLRKATGDHE